MTVNVARRGRRRSSEPPPEVRPEAISPKESLAIGEINQTVFDCPKCARPIAIGVRRCPGCGTHLVLGIPLAKVSLFTGAGLAVGIAFGLVLGFGLNLGRAASGAPGPAVAALPSQPTIPAGGGGTVPTLAPPTTAPSSAAATPDIPPISRSALSQALGVNGRLAAGAVSLRGLLAAADFDASAVAETLRSLSADSVFGQQLAGRLAAWPGTVELGRDLNAVYERVNQSATDWLVSSVRDKAAYREAAKDMVAILNGLTAVDAEARALADRVGLVIAPPAP